MFCLFSESGQTGDGTSHKDIVHEVDHSDSSDCPALVVYLVDPFTYGHEWDDLNRLAMIGLLHCYQQMLTTLPDHHQSNICLQVRGNQGLFKWIHEQENSGLTNPQ